MSRKTEPRGYSPSVKGNCSSCGGRGVSGMYQDRCTSCDGTGLNQIERTNLTKNSLDDSTELPLSRTSQGEVELDKIFTEHKIYSHNLSVQQIMSLQSSLQALIKAEVIKELEKLDNRMPGIYVTPKMKGDYKNIVAEQEEWAGGYNSLHKEITGLIQNRIKYWKELK